MKRVIVTGGSGFIGSAIVNELLTHGYDNIIVIDKKINPWTKQLADSDSRLTYIEKNIRNINTDIITEGGGIHAIIHLAANHIVPHSMTNPMLFYGNNLECAIHMINLRPTYFIHSSSAAVYGTKNELISEDDYIRPVNPYGQTMLWIEQMLEFNYHAHKMPYCNLRYFNVAGSGIRHGYNAEVATHAVPVLIKAIKAKKQFTIYGKDYPTVDGTCIRDYLHVRDVARAHINALKYLERTDEPLTANLGTGIGTSMIELVKTTELVMNDTIDCSFGPRREGDTPSLVADVTIAHDKLHWRAQYSLANIIQDAWEWENKKDFIDNQNMR